MCEKGFFASVCGFFKGLFSSSSAADSAKPAAPKANAQQAQGDGLTGVERYIRNRAKTCDQLTGVERYIRNQVTRRQTVTTVEQYIRNKGQAKALTGVERYIQSKN